MAELVGEPLVVSGERTGMGPRVAAALESVGLASTGAFLAARIAELSGGQLQRIALARALICQPKLLVADEPTAMLDASEQARLLVLLHHLQGEMGLGLVLVSHDIAVVRKVTDRIVVLDAGRIVEQGPSHLVSTRPRHPATRALIADAPALDLHDDLDEPDAAPAGPAGVQSAGDAGDTDASRRASGGVPTSRRGLRWSPRAAPR